MVMTDMLMQSPLPLMQRCKKDNRGRIKSLVVGIVEGNYTFTHTIATTIHILLFLEIKEVKRLN